MLVAGGSTNVTTYFAMRLAADDTAATGLTITGFDLQYVRSGAAPSAKVDATALAATDSAHGDNQAIEIDATDQTGLYRVDWPDAAFAAGVREVFLTVKVATAFTEHLRVELDAEVNMVAISGDKIAADNLELMYGGAGYTDATAPASRAQLGTIATVSGGSINFAPSQDNSGGTIDPSSTAFVGVETNNFTDAAAENGTRHQIADSGNIIDVVYGFQIGGDKLTSEVVIKGFVNNSGPTDDLTISAYDHNAAGWETIGIFEADSTNDNIIKTISLLSKHTGTGSEIGKAYIRFNGSSLNADADLNVDQILVSAVSIGQSAGYANGQIWVDTVNGTAGTENFVNGTADNPVLTWADALTLSGALGITDFHIINGSSITLTAAGAANHSLFGDNWSLVLAGRAIAAAHFEGANVSGVQTGDGVGFHGGEMESVTLANNARMGEVGISGTITLPAGNIEFFNCHHDGASLPVLDFGDAVGSTTVHLHSFHGGLEIQNMGDSGTDIIHLDGMGRLDINANCVGGTINVRGAWDINDSSGGAVTLVRDDISIDVAAILVDTGTTLQAEVDAIQAAVITNAAGADVAADIIALKAVADAIPTTAMRGTDSAALASVCTEGRLAELDAAKLPADVDTIKARPTTAMVESYAANGVAPTPDQAVIAIHQMLMQFGIAGASLTVRKLDDTTTAFVVTLDDATTPTDSKRV